MRWRSDLLSDPEACWSPGGQMAPTAGTKPKQPTCTVAPGSVRPGARFAGIRKVSNVRCGGCLMETRTGPTADRPVNSPRSARR